jgi:hypothetical protein
MKVWLDDRRREPVGWTRAINVAEAQALLRTGDVEERSLDHDLGACDACMEGMSTEDETNGHWPKLKPRVHSMNHKGAARMQEIIDRHFGIR